jgi:predicted transglutaminase-like cysteine proteinase
MMNSAHPPNSLRIAWTVAKRWALKTFLFAFLVLLVLNPNLKRTWMQIQHTFKPESLIQTSFPGMEEIHARLDQMVLENAGQTKEVKLIERFVYDHIRYVSDYENWWNLEYWPTAEEVWARQQEDCDGRAILAVSIMRARGYSSARLVIGLNHMWVEVDANEKHLHKPENLTELLGPDPNLSLALEKNPDARHFARLALAFFQPTAFRETSGGLIADIPPIRKIILIFLLLLFCHHPCRDLKGLAAVLLLGGSAGTLLIGSGAGHPLQFGAGMTLLAIAVLGASLMSRFATVSFKPSVQSEPAQMPAELEEMPA